MGIGVILHGYIECPGHAWTAETKRVYRANRRAILGLPISDPEWPFLTRDMFSALPLRPSWDRHIPQYENQVIHFAGDYKNVFILEADWVKKFEALLGRLFWYRAVVILEFSSLRYEWDVSLDHIADRYRSNPPQPPTEWSFRCFGVEKKPLTPGEVIDGAFAGPDHGPNRDDA